MKHLPAITLLGFAESEAEHIQQEIRIIKKQLSHQQSLLVGATERIRVLRELVAKENSQRVDERCTSREVQIAYSQGHDLKVGDALSQEVKDILEGRNYKDRPSTVRQLLKRVG
jgi:hypothetical protein